MLGLLTLVAMANVIDSYQIVLFLIGEGSNSVLYGEFHLEQWRTAGIAVSNELLGLITSLVNQGDK